MRQQKMCTPLLLHRFFFARRTARRGRSYVSFSGHNGPQAALPRAKKPSALAFIEGNAYLQAMELLDLLEQRVNTLLAEQARLREENAGLREKVSSGFVKMVAENRALKAALEEERSARQTVVDRIDALLLRLKDQTVAPE